MQPASPVVGDFNRGGRPDIAIREYSSGLCPAGVAAADLIHDGIPDLTVTNNISKSVNTLGDFNRTCKLNIAVTGDYSVTVLLNQGTK